MAKLPALLVDPDEVRMSRFLTRKLPETGGDGVRRLYGLEPLRPGGAKGSKALVWGGEERAADGGLSGEVGEADRELCEGLGGWGTAVGGLLHGRWVELMWHMWSEAADLDPDSEDSRRVRGEMATRIELGRRKTPLESFLEAVPWRRRLAAMDVVTFHP